MSDGTNHQIVAVIGAGPAGMFAARELTAAGVRVALINRDIKPGGLAEYGIYYDKYKMKDGLRKQFRLIMKCELIDYYGNIMVGQNSDIRLEELRAMGFQAVMVTVGAQGTKWLGLPGEDLLGVYHAKDIVYHYNRLPPFATHEFRIGKRVALIGVGNVMLDIAHWLVRDLKVDEVVAVARRGPAEVKFTKKEIEYISANLDVAALDAELARCAQNMQEIGQDPAAAREYILSGMPKALPAVSQTRFRFDFLASPTGISGNENKQVIGLEVEDTRLVPKGNDTKAVGLGTRRTLDVDTVIFCIGDKVDEQFGLPIQWNEFVKHPEPCYPVDGASYEAYDPQTGKGIEGVFFAGWSREASSGLVGVARKDGENGARAVLQYLKSLPPAADPNAPFARLEARLSEIQPAVVDKEDVVRLEAAESAEAARIGLDEFKFKSNEEMLKVIGN